MNTIYRVVFNRARGVLMVANEITSSVQAKGSKTVVATAVAAALSCGVSVAQEHNYTLNSGNAGYSATSADNTKLVFAEGDVLNMDITNKGTRAYGLLASGKDHVYSNKGIIRVNTNTTDNKTNFWQVKGMMADAGGTAINDGVIEATNAYGMTVGSTKGEGTSNTIINNGTINVNVGAGMEIAPTGVEGTTGTAVAVGTNNGKIAVKNGVGLLVSGNGNKINQNGILTVEKGYAVKVQVESGKTTKNNHIFFGADSNTVGQILVRGNKDKANKNWVDFVEGTTLQFDKGAKFEGNIVISGAKGTQLLGNLNISGQKGTTGAALFFGDAEGQIDLKDSTFTNNVASGVDEYGGAIYSYGIPFKQNGGAYIGNQVVSTGANNKDGREGAAGGAIMMKGNGASILTDVLFENNSVVAKKTESTGGGYAYGGALMIDYSTGNATGVVNPTDLELRVTKDMTYSGNTVSSDSTRKSFDTYGYHMPHAQAGGFLFLDRGSSVKFNVDETATLTIGAKVTDDDTDSIASSIPNANTDKNNGKHALIVKDGNGVLVVNSSLNKYYGTFDVNAGRMEVNSKWDVKNAVNVAAGSTLKLANFELLAADKTGNNDVKGNQVGASLTVSGTLETSSGQVFTTALGEDAKATDAGKKKSDLLVFNAGSTLALNDALYNLAYAESAGKLVADGRVVMLGDLVNKGEVDNTQTLDELANVGPNVDLNKVTVDAEDKNIQIGGTQQQDVAYRAEDLSVGAVDLGKANGVTVDGGKTLTLAGNGGDVIASTAKDVTVDVKNGATLALGGVASKGGMVAADVNVDANSQVVVTGNANFTIDAVKGDGKVFVGDNDAIGDVTINSLKEMTGLIVFDPAWTEGVNTVNGATKGQLNGLSKDALKASVAVTRNSIVASDAKSSDAVVAFNAIANAQGLAWKDDVTAAFYAGQQVKIDQTGGILVDGSKNKDTVTDADITKGALTVAKNGMLIVNQNNAGKPVVDGNVTLADKSYLGVVNAVVGEMTITNGTFTNNGAIVATDNPFIVGSLTNKGTLQNKLDVDAGLGTLASTGIQAMTRRADLVMSETVANRTSVDQELNPGLNLWVDVTAERYESDDLEHKGSFRSDSAYAMFGADVAMAQDITVGAGLQYGTGSLRSGVASIKNDIDSYGLTAYAAKKFGQAKVVGELAYLQAQNDITSAQTALNQKVDTKVYSAGIRGQYQLTAGNFQFVPSIGLRVSRLETDAMKVGAVNVDDQNQTYVQMPIALRINGFEQNVSGWQLAPSFKIAYVPTFGDKEIKLLGYEQDVLDTKPVQADFGIRALNGNMIFNADLMLGGGENGTSSLGGKVGMKYVF